MRSGEGDRRWRLTGEFVAELVRNRVLHVRRAGLVAVARSDLRRTRASVRRTRWALVHDCRPNAVPFFVVGAQRSGTDMLVHAFRESPEVAVYNERADSPAFKGYALRDDGVIRELVSKSRHRCVIFKSLLDSHRVVHLMSQLETPSPGRAVWAYRTMEGRVRSLVALWPTSDLRALRQIAEGAEHWQAGGLGDERLALVRSFDYSELTAESAAALHWYLRNSLFYDLALEERPDMALISYERVVDEPVRFLRMLSDFAGISYDARMAQGIARRPPATPRPLDIDRRIRDLCVQLEHRLDDELEHRVAAERLTRPVGQGAPARTPS